MLTAGRDGAICEMDILTREAVKLYQNDGPISCIAPDYRNGFFWYGTPSSTLNFFQIPDSRRHEQHIT